MLKQNLPTRRASVGYSLVELLVAMVLGLLVIGSVLALVLSMIRANNQTIAATRLTQELRATAALMSADIRRAGGVQDPLTSATAIGGQPDTTLATISTTTAGCIQYSYADAEGGNFHSIAVAGGAVMMNAGATAPCTGGTRLSSPQVEITTLQFERRDVTGVPNPIGRTIHITMVGKLRDNMRILRNEDQQFSRAYTQDIFIRSVL